MCILGGLQGALCMVNSITLHHIVWCLKFVGLPLGSGFDFRAAAKASAVSRSSSDSSRSGGESRTTLESIRTTSFFKHIHSHIRLCPGMHVFLLIFLLMVFRGVNVFEGQWHDCCAPTFLVVLGALGGLIFAELLNNVDQITNLPRVCLALLSLLLIL